MNISTVKAHMDIPQPVRKSRLTNPGWFLVSPSVALLLLWMIVPLGMTLYFSTIRYNLLDPGENAFVGLENFTYFLTDSGFLPGATNTLLLVGSVLLISVVFGVLISALLEASEFFGRGIVRVMLISPFFIMPTVGALIWKNLIFHPVSGILAYVWKLFGAQPVDWLAHYPLLSIIIIVSWQWLPFAILILMTAMQSLDQEQKEAARLDGGHDEKRRDQHHPHDAATEEFTGLQQRTDQHAEHHADQQHAADQQQGVGGAGHEARVAEEVAEVLKPDERVFAGVE